MKLLLGILVALLVSHFLVVLTLRTPYPSEERARRDFLAEHPTYRIERMTERKIPIKGEPELFTTERYLIFYRIPGDNTLHERMWRYHHTAWGWRVSR